MAESLADRAYHALRGAIAEGRLKPGRHVGETAFADRLGISRTPIREALQRLARDGLVTLDARNGARVAELSLEAGRHESAGAIFAQQEEFERAGECYEAVDHMSVAAGCDFFTARH